jgi:hypothetical protein
LGAHIGLSVSLPRNIEKYLHALRLGNTKQNSSKSVKWKVI